MKNGYIFKLYHKKNLADKIDTIQNRIYLINNFDFEKYKALVETKVTERNGFYVLKQKYFKRKPTVSLTNLKKEDMLDIVKALEYFDSIGFVHGDLNTKNIIYTENGFKIIDYEPSLIQIENGFKKLMITIPYVDKRELEEMHITTKTDKIGFFYFVLRIRNILSPVDIVRLSKNLDHQKVIKYRLKKLNYIDILEIAFSLNKIETVPNFV